MWLQNLWPTVFWLLNFYEVPHFVTSSVSDYCLIVGVGVRKLMLLMKARMMAVPSIISNYHPISLSSITMARTWLATSPLSWETVCPPTCVRTKTCDRSHTHNHNIACRLSLDVLHWSFIILLTYMYLHFYILLTLTLSLYVAVTIYYLLCYYYYCTVSGHFYDHSL